MAGNIQNNWNAKIDRTLTVRKYGKQGILYEFELPYGANPNLYYEEALNVKSIKGNNKRPSTSKKHFGKIYRPGMYQPIGNTKEFTFFKLKKLSKTEREDYYLQKYGEIIYNKYFK